MRLSAVIITLNEEKDLPGCLKSLKDFADEIVLVDSGSTDKTIDIAKNFKVKVFFRKFDNYANQKNYAASKASGDWILSVDADEEIEAELAEEIESVIKKQKAKNNKREGKIVAYTIPRKNIILGKYIKHTRWQPELDRHVWLWRKGVGEWVGEVHEEFVVKGNIGRLEHHKIHYQYETVGQFLGMMNIYSEIEATQKIKNGNKFSLARMFFDPEYNFFVRYFYRLGFLDGWRGFILSYLMAIYHLIVWVKVWEKSGYR